MQSFGFSLPLTLSTLITYIVLFFAQGFNNKDSITVGHIFYLDKPQGKLNSSIFESHCSLLHSTWFKTSKYIFNWIFTFMVIKNENNKSCLVSYN